MRKLLAAAAPTIVATLILVGAAVFGLRDEWPWPTDPRPAPRLEQLFSQTVDTLRRGETVSQLFARQGISSFQMGTVNTGFPLDLRRLRAGLSFSFRRGPTDSTPSEVLVRTGPEQRVSLRLAGGVWNATTEPIPWRMETVTLEGTIRTSLYEALAGMDVDSILSSDERLRAAWDLADVFAWQVDFSRDLRAGDGFRLVAERLISEDGEVRLGRILAGNLAVGGRRYTAYRFTPEGGRSGFYDEDGLSLRRAFLLAPVEFRRISSRPSSRREHPIFGTVRRHEGTDFAADAGTPVMAAGDGVVARREWSGGYGNLVELSHANGIVTRYGHLRAFARGLVTGQRVAQGDVIGYVGSTGLATGPHLHYEFRVNGVSRDPRATDLGTGEPILPAARLDFDRERARLATLLGRPAGPALAAGNAAARKMD